MTEAAFNPEAFPEVHNKLVADWHAKLTDILLTHGAAEADGTYYATALDSDTYVSVTNYATASCHLNYRINGNDRSQRTSLEIGDPIISVEFRHIKTDDVKQGYVICQLQNVRPDSIIGATLTMTNLVHLNTEEFVIIKTSDATEVSAEDALDSPLSLLLDRLN